MNKSNCCNAKVTLKRTRTGDYLYCHNCGEACELSDKPKPKTTKYYQVKIKDHNVVLAIIFRATDPIDAYKQCFETIQNTTKVIDIKLIEVIQEDTTNQ